MTNRYTPVIILPGIGQSKVQVTDSDGNVLRDAWPLSCDVESVFNPLKGPLMKMMLFRRDAGFSDAAAKAVGSLVDDLTVFPNGMTKFRLKVVRWDYPMSEYDKEQKRYLNKMVPVKSLAEKIGEENIYFFAYNSFGDAYATADELNNYIQKVKEKTGSEKVDLMPVSLGGALMLAYLDKYGEKCDISRVVNVVAAIGGTNLMSDIFELNFNFSNPAELIKKMGKITEESFGDIIGMLPEGVLEATVEKSAEAILQRIGVNSTLIWGTAPRDRYIVLKQKYLLDGEHDRIAADADKLHRIHVDLQTFVSKLKLCGVDFYNICGYGKSLFAVCGSDDISSDGLINTASASMGATCAAPGEVFPTDYEPVDPNIENAVSPDRSVDISSCVLPNKTWFFADQDHNNVAYNDVVLKLIERILSDSDFTDVNSDPAFPQFNGSRNVKKLKNELYPKFEEIDYNSLSDDLKVRYNEVLEHYNNFMAQTVVCDNSRTQLIEEDIQTLLDLI